MKKQYLKIIVISVIAAFFLNLFFGRYLMAKISTLPILNRFNILNPQAPIVINNREEIRVSENKDILDAINGAKSKISSVVLVKNNQVLLAGGSINLASEGIFLTAPNVFAEKNGNYFVILSDGQSAKVQEQTIDPATKAVFFKANLGNLAIAPLGSSQDLKSGDKVGILANSIQAGLFKAEISQIISIQSDTQGQSFAADFPMRSFGLQNKSFFMPGDAVVNLKGEIVGIWSSDNSIISSDVLKALVDSYFSNQQKIVRPRFGFAYSIISQAESSLLNLPQGILVSEVDRLAKTSDDKLPSFQAGLMEKDVITAINDENLGGKNIEEILQKFKPQDKLKLNVSRGSKTLNLTLTVGELK